MTGPVVVLVAALAVLVIDVALLVLAQRHWQAVERQAVLVTEAHAELQRLIASEAEQAADHAALMARWLDGLIRKSVTHERSQTGGVRRGEG